MRPGPDFVTRGSPGAAATAASPHGSAPHSTWHSPVPYLFGGLAAMLGLIAFALLILACSYWKISGYPESERGGGDGDGDGDDQHDGGKPGNGSGNPSPAFFEEKILVIMAGDCKPTFLATPIASRAVSLEDKAAADDSGTAEGQGTKLATQAAVNSLPGDATGNHNINNHLNDDDSSERDYDQSQNNSSQF